MNRKIIFITGSHHSGKSRLGHMLATYEDCLYNYLTPSPQQYFSENNGLLIEPRESTLIALKKLVIKQCEFLSGALSPHDNKPWLGGDQLFDYDYKKFSIEFCNSLTNDIDVAGFYLLWDKYLQNNRKNGSSSKFTVFEIEGIEGTKFVDLINNKILSAKFISVIRKPIDQIRSLKADILVRGPNNNEYAGALSSVGNTYFEYLKSLMDQYTWLVKCNNDKKIEIFRFEELLNIKEEIGNKISRIVYGRGNINLAKHLVNMSLPDSIFKNKYVSFKRDGASYYKVERQEHLPIKVRKDNLEDYSYRFERRFYQMINNLQYFNSRKKSTAFLFNYMSDIILYPILLIFSLLFGFKEIRNWLSLRNRVIIRKNSFITLYTFGIKAIFLNGRILFN